MGPEVDGCVEFQPPPVNPVHLKHSGHRKIVNQIIKYRSCISLNKMVNRREDGTNLDAIFAALAHPIRRAILEQVSGGDATVSELAEPHKVSPPAISRHLRVLEDAGLIEVEPEGRVHRIRIDAAPLSAAFGWLTRYRVLWEDRLDRLAEHLAGRTKKSKSRTTRGKRNAK